MSRFHKICAEILDVRKIKKIWYHKRLFSILQRDLPYELSIDYKTSKPSPIVYSSAVYNISKHYERKTYRFPSYEDVMREQGIIANKIKQSVPF